MVTGVTDRTMVEETCKVTEGEHKGCRGCFGWLLRMFRRRRGRRSVEHMVCGEPSVDDVQAELESEVKPAENVSEKILPKITSEDLLLCVMEVAEEQQEYMEAKSLEGWPAEEERKGEAVLTWAEEVTQAEEQGLDVFAPVSDALLNVLRHFAPDTVTQGEGAASDHGRVRNAAVTATPAARRRARRKALKALRAQSRAQAVNTDAAATTPAAAETLSETSSSAEETTVAEATTREVSVTAEEDNAAANARSGRMSTSRRRKARRRAAASKAMTATMER